MLSVQFDFQIDLNKQIQLPENSSSLPDSNKQSKCLENDHWQFSVKSEFPRSRAIIIEQEPGGILLIKKIQERKKGN